MTYLQQAFGNKNPNLPFHPAVRAGDYVRVGPGGQGRERRHAGRHHRTADARHHRSDAAGAAGGRLRPGRRGQGHRLPGRRARFWPLQRRVQEYFPDGMLRARPWRPARSSTPRSRSSASPTSRSGPERPRKPYIKGESSCWKFWDAPPRAMCRKCCSCSKSWARRTSATITARPSRAPRSPRNTRPSTPRRRCRPCATASCTCGNRTPSCAMWPTSRKPTRCIRAIPPRAARSSAGWTGRWPRSTWPTWPASRKPSCRPSN